MGLRCEACCGARVNTTCSCRRWTDTFGSCSIPNTGRSRAKGKLHAGAEGHRRRTPRSTGVSQPSGRSSGGSMKGSSHRFPTEAIEQILHPKSGEWPTYNGLLSANRHSPLTQINAQNVSRLKPEWTYSLPYDGLQTTPLVSDGVMYVSGPNRVCALDSRTGREIWCYSRARGTGGYDSGRRRQRREPRCGSPGGSDLFRDRQCALDLPAPPYRQFDVGRRLQDSRRAGTLRVDRSAAGGRRPGDYGRFRAAMLRCRDLLRPTRRLRAARLALPDTAASRASRVRRPGKARRSIPEARQPG